jgi:hypothetical protein
VCQFFKRFFDFSNLFVLIFIVIATFCKSFMQESIALLGFLLAELVEHAERGGLGEQHVAVLLGVYDDAVEELGQYPHCTDFLSNFSEFLPFVSKFMLKTSELVFLLQFLDL